MRSFHLTSIVTLSSLCLFSNAFPLIPRSLLQKKAPQSYSVVAVDGGSSPTTAPSTHTVTNRLTQTAYTTILSTIVLTESETPVTIVVTATSATTITQTIPTVSIASITVTASPTQPAGTQAVVTSSAYDDGSWHTTYYSRWTIPAADVAVASSSVLISSSVPAPIPTTTSTKTITPATTVATASATVAPTKSSSTTPPLSTVTDWATYYGSALATPKNGSWWG